jgi:hypothetical protein
VGIGCRSALGQHLGKAGLGLLHPTAVPVGGHQQPPGPEAWTVFLLGHGRQRRACELALPLPVASHACDLGAQQGDRRPRVGHHPAFGGHLELPEIGSLLESCFDVLEPSFHLVDAIAVPLQHRLCEAEPGT